MSDMYMSVIVSLNFRNYSIAYCPISATTKILPSEFHWEYVKVLPRLMLTDCSFCSREIEWCAKEWNKMENIRL